MPRVSKATKDKVENYVKEIKPDLVDKCALCNQTLTHMIKTGEVATGAGQLTVCNAIAKAYNAVNPPADHVTGKVLRDRVDRFSKFIVVKRDNNSAVATVAARYKMLPEAQEFRDTLLNFQESSNDVVSQNEHSPFAEMVASFGEYTGLIATCMDLGIKPFKSKTQFEELVEALQMFASLLEDADTK